ASPAEISPLSLHDALPISLILRGRPSFTRLLRISFGLVNHSTTKRFTGQLWFDELRATEVAKDVGLADRINVNGRVANLMDYNRSEEHTSELQSLTNLVCR